MGSTWQGPGLPGTHSCVPTPCPGHSQTWAVSGLRRGSPPLSSCLVGTGSAPSGCDQQSTAQGNTNTNTHTCSTPALRDALSSSPVPAASGTPKFPQGAPHSSRVPGQSPAQAAPPCPRCFFTCSAPHRNCKPTQNLPYKHQRAIFSGKRAAQSSPSLLLPQPGITLCSHRGI